MSEVSWIRITTTMFDDEKIRIIEAMPDSDSILIVWIKLLTLCGRCNANGYIMLTEDIPYNDEMLATIMNRPLSVVRLALQTFERFGMIRHTGQGIYIANWEKHQNIEGLERIKEQNRIRKQRQRAKEKQLAAGSVTGQSQQSHALDKEEDKEVDIDKEVQNTCSASVCAPTPLNVDYPPEFEQFWHSYPKERRSEKKAACRAWKARLQVGATPEQLITAAMHYAQECTGKEARYIKLPKTFLGPDDHWQEYQMPRGAPQTKRFTFQGDDSELEEAVRRKTVPLEKPLKHFAHRHPLADLQTVIQRKTMVGIGGEHT